MTRSKSEFKHHPIGAMSPDTYIRLLHPEGHLQKVLDPGLESTKPPAKDSRPNNEGNNITTDSLVK